MRKNYANEHACNIVLNFPANSVTTLSLHVSVQMQDNLAMLSTSGNGELYVAVHWECVRQNHLSLPHALTSLRSPSLAWKWQLQLLRGWSAAKDASPPFSLVRR